MYNGSTALNDSRRKFGYPSLHFSPLQLSHGGLYEVTITNYYTYDPRLEYGTSTLAFNLDVLCKYTIIS